MSNRRFRVYLEKDTRTGLFAVRCLEMSVFSQGRSEAEALKNIKDAIVLHLESIEEGLNLAHECTHLYRFS